MKLRSGKYRHKLRKNATAQRSIHKDCWSYVGTERIADVNLLKDAIAGAVKSFRLRAK